MEACKSLFWRNSISYQAKNPSDKMAVSPLSSFASNLFSSQLFPDPTHPKCRPDAAERDKYFFREIGGEEVTLEKEDGMQLEGFYFSADEFESRLDDALSPHRSMLTRGEDRAGNAFACLPPRDNSEMAPSQQMLGLKPFKKTGSLTEVVTYFATSDNKPISYEENSEEKYAKRIWALPIPSNGSEVRALDPAEGEEAALAPRSTVILSIGLSVIYTIYQELIGRLLLNGMNVMVYNPSGRGLSDGRPSSVQWQRDAEAVYAHVSSLGTPDKRIIVWASCYGLVAGAPLAVRHPGVNLIADRCFDQFASVAGRVVSASRHPRIQPGVSAAITWAVSCAQHTENSAAISKVRGHLLIVTDLADEVVSFKESIKLVQAMPDDGAYIQRTLFTSVGHRGNWLKKAEPMQELQTFLEESGLTQTAPSLAELSATLSYEGMYMWVYQANETIDS